MPKIFISIVTDFQIIVAILMILCAWRLGDWRNWRLYYPTILFFAVCDFAYGLLSYNYPLWEYESPLLKTILSEIFLGFTFVPATLLIYLPHFPSQFKKQVPYVLLWVIIYSIIEKASHLLGYFSYHNNWNIWWSVLFNCIMFPFLYLHHKRPQWAILLSLLVAIIILIYFKVPYSSIK